MIEAIEPGRDLSAARVEKGVLHVYRLFDVADAVDLAAAEALVRAPQVEGAPSRLRLEGAQTSAAIEIPRPPVQLALGPRKLPLRSGERTAEAYAKVYDFGVVSVVYKLPIAPGTPLEALIPLAEELVVAPTGPLDAAARREAEELARTLDGALEHAHAWEGFETFQLFFIEVVEGRPLARELLARAPIARLLLGETSAVALSKSERIDVLKHHFSYLADDLAVIDWNCAFVYEPSGVRDIPELLEFATAHLLELRFYDALLDRELQALYDEMETAPRHALVDLFTGRHRRLQRRTASLLLELSEMIERLENAVKIIGDFYLARLYQSAVRRFRLPAWEETVLRKQRLLAEVNQLLGDAVDTNRDQLMELAILILIVGELLLALRGVH